MYISKSQKKTEFAKVLTICYCVKRALVKVKGGDALFRYGWFCKLYKGRFQKKETKKLMEFFIMGPDPASQHPQWKN